jgi:hypothetical protein
MIQHKTGETAQTDRPALSHCRKSQIEDRFCTSVRISIGCYRVFDSASRVVTARRGAGRLYSRCVDDIARENGKKLAGLLRGRDGWQRGTQDGEEYWYFGVDGAARLTIHPEMDGFLVYIADQDPGAVQRASWVIPRIESVEEWLDEHEAEHAGLTPLQEEFKRALEEKEPGTSDT